MTFSREWKLVVLIDVAIVAAVAAGVTLMVCCASGKPSSSNELAPHPRRFDPANVSCQDDGFERWNESAKEYR